MPTVYLETTVVSYLTAWRSRDLIRAAQQMSTREWWDIRRGEFDLVTSELVLIEAAAGDPTAAAERLKVLTPLTRLAVTEPAAQVADALVAAGAVPLIASRDALHIGICAVSGVDFLLTWNFRHLANAILRDRIRQTCEGHGFHAPVICTPDELLGATP